MLRHDSHFRVRSSELDSLGHVNHAVYLHYLEQARYDALEAGGLSPATIRSRGWGIFVVRIEVDYRRECFHNQVLRVTTQVEAFRKASMVVSQELRREEDGPSADPALMARVTLVWVDGTGRPIRVPMEARRALGEGDGPL